jgi:hypothetical protein
MAAMSTSGRISSRGARLAGLAVLLAFGAGLAACGSSSTATTTTTTTSGVTGSTGSAGNSGGSGNTGSASASLSSLTSLANAGKSATFEAVYTYTPTTGKSETITFAQSPPKSLFKVGSTGFILNDGTTSSYCAMSTCYTSAASADPLASLTFLFDGQTFRDSVAAYDATTSALAAEGITLSYSDATYAGQPSKCVTVNSTKGGGSTFTWCVASNGIMTSWTSGSATFALTSFTSSPPASDFVLPAGYTTVTIP